MLATLLFAPSLAQAPLLPTADSSAFPTDTRIPIRFLEPISSGRDSVGTLVRVQTMAPLTASARRAPMSHQYSQGRIKDLAFERASPSARKRHHVRVWQAETAGTLWVSEANEDIGLLISPLKGHATHRIAPAIDHERDLLARELLASGCAGFEGYTSLPGAVRAGTNAAGQAFTTDGQTAVLGLRQCPQPES